MTAARKLQETPRYLIEEWDVNDDQDGLELTIDSPEYERTYVIDLKFDPMADDRLAIIGHWSNDGNGCVTQHWDLPPLEVRELQRWLECDSHAVRLIENKWAEVRCLAAR